MCLSRIQARISFTVDFTYSPKRNKNFMVKTNLNYDIATKKQIEIEKHPKSYTYVVLLRKC